MSALLKSSSNTGLKHLFLVDGSGYIFRAYHGLPPMTRADGTPVNAVYGYTNMLLKLVDETDADHVAVIFDAKRKNFRNDIYADYKANRSDPPEDLIPQFGLIREATRALNVACIDKEGYEADDLIATYARQAAAQGAEVTIVSSDKDLMQLVSDKISLWDPMKSRTLSFDQVMEKFGVSPEKVIDVQALAGDSSDNVPGVPGIGVKTAAQLINEYGSLEELLVRAEEIKQPKRRESLINHAEDARISKQLVTLKEDVEGIPTLGEMAVQEQDPATVTAFLEENQFKAILSRYRSRHGDGVATDGTSPAGASPIEADYELVTTESQLQNWITRIKKAGIVAVDTETNSLNARAAKLVGISLSTDAGNGCYIPLNHVQTLESTIKQLPFTPTLDALKEVLEASGIIKVGQNIKYDYGVLSRNGIHLDPVEDTMLLSYVLAAGARSHGMDVLAEIYLDHTTIKYKDIVGTGKKQRTFDEVAPEEAVTYAAEDADITLRLYHLLKQELFQEKLVRVYETLERPLAEVISNMEQNGIKVDPKMLYDLSADFEQRLGVLEGEIHKLAGTEFNVGSPKQLGEILFDSMGLDGAKKTKTGAYQTGSEILEGLAAKGHDIAQKVLDWRQLSKLKSTYTDALQAQINPETGRVHTSFSMAGTSTGRLSSSDPNVQNIPIRTEEGRKIREAFVADKGHKLISVDYSQIELRLMAHIADVKNLQQAFHDGLDIHAHTASLVFGVPMDGMDPMVRRNAKAINFGIIYGISAFGLARQLGISNGEAKEFIDAYFARFPEIRTYMESTKEQAAAHGYVETLYGRRCYTPGIKDKNPNMRNFAERAAINAPLQGTAADIIKRAMIQLPPALVIKGLDAKMLLQVHDELIFEAPEDQAQATLQEVTRVMEQAATPVVQLSVPLIAEGSIGNTWGEAH